MENTKIKANLQFNLLKENNSNYLKLIHPPKLIMTFLSSCTTELERGGAQCYY